MFSEKKNKLPLERNIIGKTTSITGDISSEGDFRIDGKLEGSIETKGRVVIGKEGNVTGKIICNEADVEGTFSGNLQVLGVLTLKATATICGDVITGKLSVEPGANFNATCTMKGFVKELKNEKAKKEKSA